MNLEDILISFNGNSYKFFELLQKSEDPRCKDIFARFMRNESIFTALLSHTDKLGKCMLMLNNVSCLNLLGRYMQYSKNIKRKTFFTLVYPSSLLLVFTIIVSCFERVKITDNAIYFNRTPPMIYCALLVMTSYWMFQWIRRQFHTLVKHMVLLNFLEKKINLEQLLFILSLLNIKNTLDIITSSNFPEICLIIVGKKYYSQQEITNKYIELHNNLDEKLNQIMTIISRSFLVATGICITWMNIDILHKIFSEFMILMYEM